MFIQILIAMTVVVLLVISIGLILSQHFQLINYEQEIRDYRQRLRRMSRDLRLQQNHIYEQAQLISRIKRGNSHE